MADGVEYPVAIKELKSQGNRDELSAIEREGVGALLLVAQEGAAVYMLCIS